MHGRKDVKFKLVDAESDIVKSYEERWRPKRSRILLTEMQNIMLEQSFRENPYPDRAEKYNLFLKTKVPMKNVKIWFQNRRAREKHAYEDSGTRKPSDFNPGYPHFADEFHEYYKF